MQMKFMCYPATCSFCGKKAKEIGPLIKNEGKHEPKICHSCLVNFLEFFAINGDVARKKNREIIQAEIDKNIEKHNQKLLAVKPELTHTSVELTTPKPSEIKAMLDKHIVSQEDAKRKISIAIYNHVKKIMWQKETNDEDIQLSKSNILLLGPTGSGKSLLAKTIARKLNVPIAIGDATALTEAGYVGDDVNSLIQTLFNDAEGNKEETEHGIIYIDEIDKLRKGNNYYSGKSVGDETVQQALLPIIEGKIVTVTKHSIDEQGNPQKETIEIDTSNILFILGGAFVGLEEVIQRRKNEKGIGFGAKVVKEKKIHDFTNVQTNDLIKFGFIPEFVGRIPVRAVLQELSSDDLVKILTEVKNAPIKEYQELMKRDGVDLIFTEEALYEIAKRAKKENCGARGLRTILEKTLENAMFDIPSSEKVKSCIINAETVRTGHYKLEYHKEFYRAKIIKKTAKA